MNTITFECDESIYLSIPSEIREDISIKTREPKDYDYSTNEKWQEMKRESTKAYKKLKELEYKIRFNK